jgi:hypothetical protein
MDANDFSKKRANAQRRPFSVKRSDSRFSGFMQVTAF